ncbi:hypothetical protein Tco_0260297 [Tanacetum coccineum]
MANTPKIWRIDLVSFVVFGEVQAQIHRIFLDGYDVLGRLRCKGVTKQIVGVIPKGLALRVVLGVSYSYSKHLETDKVKSSQSLIRGAGYVTVIMEYFVKPIRRIQDFDELKDHCLTLKNTPYPHQRYVVYNTLVKDEEGTSFTSIRRIHQEDTAYPCLHFTRYHEGFKSNTPYPGTSIRRIQDLLYTKILEDIKRGPYSKKSPIRHMDDPNITMEEYIRLEEEKTRRRGKVYNWETAMYGKIWDNEDVHDLGSVENEFPSIVFNDTLTSKTTLSYESTPMVSSFDDLDFFKDFEKEFPAIVYNDAQTSKLDFSTGPVLNPQHIDEFDLKDETSLSECNEEEQNILNFNHLFPFNVIYPDD